MNRIRKYPMNANPLFEKWLEEWKQAAIERDSPIQHSFNKALGSLKSYPLCCERGKNCITLRGFGRKLCEMLDKKLEEQLKLHGLPPESVQSDLIRTQFGKGKKRKNADPTSDDEEKQPDDPPEAKKRKKAAPKPYVPKVGSGAYALLITMFTKSQEPGYRGYMLKKDLMSDAQEYCNSPMKATATEHYSGWSSMTTLIQKHYVIKVSNPAKYSLTDSGVALAMSLYETKLRDDSGPSCNNGVDQSLPHNVASSSKHNRDLAVASSSKSPGKRSVNHVQAKTPADFESALNLNDEDREGYNDFFGKDTPPKTDSTGNSSNETPKKQFNPDDYGPLLTDAEFDEYLKENIRPETNNTHDYRTPASPEGGPSYESTSPLKSSQEKSYEYLDNIDSGKSPANLDDSFRFSPPSKNKKKDCKVVDDVIILDDDDEDDDIQIQPKTDDINVDESPSIPIEESSQLNSKASYCDSAFDESPSEKIDTEKTQNTSFEDENGMGSPVPGTSSSSGQKHSPEKIDDVIIIDDDDDDDDDFLKNEGINLQANFLDRVKESCRLESASSCGSEEEFQRFCQENEEPVIAVRKRPNPIIKELLEPPSSSHNFEEIQENAIEDRIETPDVIDDSENVKEREDQEIRNVISSVHEKEPVSNKDELKKHEDQETQNFILPSQEKEMVRDKEKTKKRKDKETKNPLPASQGKKSVEEDSNFEPFILPPNNFDIILLVDTQETCGSKTKPKDDATISELTKNKVMFEVRSLKVGDFTWIARCRFTNKELILPYIIERKRIDDLASSILDGRYNEQKFRLHKSGLNNVIYLIENYGRVYHGALPITSLMQAAVNSTVQDEFVVKFTRDHRDSMKYLTTLTSMLIKNYKDKELRSCRKKDLETPDPNFDKNSERLLEFSNFNKSAVKTRNYNVREMLIRQLLQLKGMSVDKASAIVELYPTPKVLAAACKYGDEKLIADIKAGPSKRKIGPVIGKTVHQFYTKLNLA